MQTALTRSSAIETFQRALLAKKASAEECDCASNQDARDSQFARAGANEENESDGCSGDLQCAEHEADDCAKVGAVHRSRGAPLGADRKNRSHQFPPINTREWCRLRRAEVWCGL